MSRTLVVLLLLAITVFCQSPDIILVNSTNLNPEGLEWHPTLNQFLLSSLGFGTVFLVADNGDLTPFVQDTSLVGSTGLQVDTQRNMLYICNVNASAVFGRATSGFMSGLVVANLSNGEVVSSLDLSDLGVQPNVTRFANDLTYDSSGNIYLTDSFGASIWKVDATTMTPSIFVSDARWVETNPLILGIGLNGIEYRNDYIIAAKFIGELYKISNLTGTPQVTQVSLNSTTPAGFDGIIFAPNGTLYAVCGVLNRVFAITSDDEWETATVVAQATSTLPEISTATLRGSDLYVVHARFTTANGIFEIEKVNFESAGSTTGGSTTSVLSTTGDAGNSTTGASTTGMSTTGMSTTAGVTTGASTTAAESAASYLYPISFIVLCALLQFI